MVLVWCGVFVCGCVVFLLAFKARVSNTKIMDFGEVYKYKWKSQLQSAVFGLVVLLMKTTCILNSKREMSCIRSVSKSS